MTIAWSRKLSIMDTSMMSKVIRPSYVCTNILPERSFSKFSNPILRAIVIPIADHKEYLPKNKSFSFKFQETTKVMINLINFYKFYDFYIYSQPHVVRQRKNVLKISSTYFPVKVLIVYSPHPPFYT